MATYVILSQLSAHAYQDPEDFKRLAADVTEKIKKECPSVEWKESYSTLGRFDVVDIVETDNHAELERAAMIIRGHGRATTETLTASPWKEFLKTL